MYTLLDGGAGALSPSMAKPRKPSEPSPAERLYREVQAHRETQAAILAEAKHAASWASSPLAAFLLGMIQESEIRQSNIVDRISSSLRDGLYWTHSSDALPDGTGGSERAETIKSVQKLSTLEQERARTARCLATAFSGIDGGLEQALLDASATVSESNSRLLKSMLRSFEAKPKGTTRTLTAREAAAQQALAGRPAAKPREDEDEPTLAA